MPRTADWVKRHVSPLELFFDLAFVLAIIQATHHLIAHLSWQGVGETLIMLVAICGVWAFTSFEVTLLDVERSTTRWVTVIVMGLALFMNAGIAHAFGAAPWLFVVPMLLAFIGSGAYAALTAPTGVMREHFRRVLIWVAASSPLWVVGAVVDAESRFWLWAVAALLDLIGTFTAHRLPGRAAQTERLPFDADHMLERMRLFLIILLGESVLSLGRAIAHDVPELLTLMTATGGFIALVSLWYIYFGRGERAVVEHVASVEDPIRAVHLGICTIYGVVAGLVLFAVGMEMAVAHPVEAGVAGPLLLAGSALYLGAQAIYFRTTIGRAGWITRILGAALLACGAVGAYWVPALAAVMGLAIVLPVLARRLAVEA